MDEDIACQLIGCESAHAVWTTVAAMFGAQSHANVRHIRQLQSLRKDEMSTAEYMHKMKALADTMAAASSPIRDDELIDHILTGLGSAYNSIAASLGVSNAAMPYSSFYSLVLSFEALQAQQSAVEGWSPSANAVTRSGSYGAGRRAPYSDPYLSPVGGRPTDGHGQPGQSRQGGNGGNSGGRERNAGYAGNGRQGGGGNAGNNSGGGGRRNRWRPRCQICKNWGHEADDCRKRYDQDYNSRSANSASTNTVDFPWVLDTGATDHLTNDLERLQVHARYDGKDQVQVANGAGRIYISRDVVFDETVFPYSNTGVSAMLLSVLLRYRLLLRRLLT
ncbi:uncharacterized protein [Aegilops tauschii subsp. strangulata]|uniref:uncharacterized protein n=1 Tax=Aegilops tauschii subsp. strangulata TaxID=200361 RepID=UPI00098A8A25